MTSHDMMTRHQRHYLLVLNDLVTLVVVGLVPKCGRFTFGHPLHNELQHSAMKGQAGGGQGRWWAGQMVGRADGGQGRWWAGQMVGGADGGWGRWWAGQMVGRADGGQGRWWAGQMVGGADGGLGRDDCYKQQLILSSCHISLLL